MKISIIIMIIIIIIIAFQLAYAYEYSAEGLQCGQSVQLLNVKLVVHHVTSRL